MFRYKLKSKVREEFLAMFNRSNLVLAARRGEFTEKQLVVYLRNLEHLFFQNADQMLQAVQTYSYSSELSSFFYSKWKEERGHDKWAKEDQRNFNSFEDFTNEILPEMSDLTEFLSSTMRKCPLSYLTYFYYAEFMTAEIGPKWMEIILTSIKVDKKNISALGNHIELDGDHASEVLDFLDKNNVPVSMHIKIFEFVEELTLKYEAFFEAIWRLEANEGSKDSQRFSSAS